MLIIRLNFCIDRATHRDTTVSDFSFQSIMIEEMLFLCEYHCPEVYHVIMSKRGDS